MNIFQKSDKSKSERHESKVKDAEEEKKDEKLLTTNNDPLQDSLSTSSNKAADYYVKGDVDVSSLKQRKTVQEQE